MNALPKSRGMLAFIYAIFVVPLLIGLIFLFYKYQLMFLTPIAVVLGGALVVMLVNETSELKVSKGFIGIMIGLSIALTAVIGIQEHVV